MGFNSNRWKEQAERYTEEYDLERALAFQQEIVDFVTSYKSDTDPITEDDIQDLVDNFDFPDVEDWVADQIESDMGAYADMKYDEMRDERLGI